MQARIATTVENFFQLLALTPQKDQAALITEYAPHLPPQTLTEFIQLVNLIPQKDRSAVIAAYAHRLGELITTIDQIFSLFAELDRDTKDELVDKYSAIFVGAFQSVQDIVTFKSKDKDGYRYFDSLTKKHDSQFTQALIALFTKPVDILFLAEKNKEAAERLFKFKIPVGSANALVTSTEYFARLRKASSTLAVTAVVGADDVLANETLADLEGVIRLAEIHRDLPRRHNYAYSSYGNKVISHHETRDGRTIDVDELLLNTFKRILASEQHNLTVADLTQKDNFLRLYHANKLFADVLRRTKKLNVIEILLGNDLTIMKFKVLICLEEMRHRIAQPLPMIELHDLTHWHSADIIALFTSAEEIRNFCSIDYGRSILETHFSEKELKTLGHQFALTAKLVDWLWLARIVADRNRDPNSFSLTRLASSALKEHPFNNISETVDKGNLPKDVRKLRHVFNKTHALISLTAACPGFASKVCDKLLEFGIDIISPFAGRRNFWKLLQAGGDSWLFSGFSLRICAAYPNHIAYIHHRSDHFAELDPKFVDKLLTHPHTQNILERSDDNSYVLQNFPYALDNYDLRKNPNNLLQFAKNEDDLIGLLQGKPPVTPDNESSGNSYTVYTNHGMSAHNGATDRQPPTGPFGIVRKGSNDYGYYEFKHSEIAKYVKSVNCQIPAKLQSFAEPGAVYVQLINVNYYLAEQLMYYHCEKLVLLFDFKSFIQLPTHFQYHFVNHSPDVIANICTAESIRLNDLFNLLKKLGNRDEQDGFNKMFKQNAAKFAKIFILGTPADQAMFIKTYPIITNILFEQSAAIMAQAFRGAAFTELLKTSPVSAALLLNNCKDSIASLIPTAADLTAVNMVNRMLMKQFAALWPEQAVAQLAAINTASQSTSLPSVATNWSSLHAQPNKGPEAANEEIKKLTY